MTTPDADVLERLRVEGTLKRLRAVEPPGGDEHATRWYRNPDGPDAATLIEALLAAITTARDAVDHRVRRHQHQPRDGGPHVSDTPTAPTPERLPRLHKTVIFSTLELEQAVDPEGTLAHQRADAEREVARALLERADVTWEKDDGFSRLTDRMVMYRLAAVDWREVAAARKALLDAATDGAADVLERLTREHAELLDALQDMVDQNCYDDASNTYDSMALSAHAHALRVLAEHGRVAITHEVGRRVIAHPVRPAPEEGDRS